MGLESRESWWRVKAHKIPVARYLGKGSNGTEMLRKELEGGNEGVRIPSTVHWLSGAPGVKARHKEGIIRASSVVLAVANEDIFRFVCKGRLRLQGHRYEVETYEKARPDVGCGHCCEWGYIEPQCPRAVARCGWCAEGHKTKEHRCPVEGYRAKKGHWCQHTAVKCANCRGPHFAQANVCPKKRTAYGGAKGAGLPPHVEAVRHDLEAR